MGAMTAQPSLLRALRLLALIVQLALPSLGVIADASHGEELLNSRVHVEPEGYDCSERGHSEHCALCHFLRAPVLAGNPVHEPVGDAARSWSPPSDPVSAGTRERLPSLPRGPPLLS